MKQDVAELLRSERGIRTAALAETEVPAFHPHLHPTELRHRVRAGAGKVGDVLSPFLPRLLPRLSPRIGRSTA